MVIPWDEDGDPAKVETRWVQEGFNPPTGFAAVQDDFSASDGLGAVPTVASDIYFSRLGLDYARALELPDCLPHALDKLDRLDPEVRKRFLRACYWVDQATQVWPRSRSLAFLAQITAVETLALAGGPPADPCPECGANRALGSTARFKEFVEKFAGSVSAKERDDLYKLRGKLIHGRRLLESDVDPWKISLDPLALGQWNLQTTASLAPRVAVINWVLSQ